jgi:hypothetical protein
MSATIRTLAKFFEGELSIECNQEIPIPLSPEVDCTKCNVPF